MRAGATPCPAGQKRHVRTRPGPCALVVARWRGGGVGKWIKCVHKWRPESQPISDPGSTRGSPANRSPPHPTPPQTSNPAPHQTWLPAWASRRRRAAHTAAPRRPRLQGRWPGARPVVGGDAASRWVLARVRAQDGTGAHARATRGELRSPQRRESARPHLGQDVVVLADVGDIEAAEVLEGLCP
jgi:hypothetical protein